MRVVKDSPLSVGWITFPIRPPKQTLVVVVKATFDLVEEGTCPLSDEQELVTGDAFWDDDVEKSVRYDSDLAITKPQGEWWVTGVWRPSTKRAATHAVVDVRVGDQRKQVAIIGDRWWQKGLMGGVTDPLPLGEVPLSLDRAFGGPKHRDNPHGMGMVADPEDSEQRIRLPNLEDPRSPIGSASDRPKPASLFPIPRTHPSRMALTGTYSGSYMSTRWPYYPEDFRWSHFQAAPDDQRVDGFFRGDESIEATQLHPDRSRVRCRLPGITPRVFLQPAGGAPGSPLTQVAMVLDTIVLDATEAKALAVWRGHVEGVQESLEDVSHVFLVHEPTDQVRTISEYRAWFDRKLAEEDAEDAAFEPEPLPAEVAPTDAAEPPPNDEGDEGDEGDEEVEEKSFHELRREELLSEGMPLEVVDLMAPPPMAPPPPQDPAEVARELEEAIVAMRELGNEELAVALEGAREPTPEDEEEAPAEPPRVEPAAPTAREEVEEALAKNQSLVGNVFAEVDLSGLDFSGLDLTGCVFLRCNLREVCFRRAVLDGATLETCVADGAVFEEASLREAALHQLAGQRVSFQSAILEDTQGEEMRLPEADFRGAQASRAEFARGDFSGACFDGAVFDEAEFSRCNLTGARFVEASLVDAWLDDGVVAKGALFEAANLNKLRGTGSDFSDAGFKWVKADEARFGQSLLDRATFSFADLADADFSDTSCVQITMLAVQAPRAQFERASLVGAQMGRANLNEANFMDANLHHADLRGANLFRAEFYRTRVEDTLFELANLKSTKLENR